MSERANVSSIAALQEFRAAIGLFVEEAGRALMSADAEIARIHRALSHELPTHWKLELRRREENVVKARIALEQALASREMGKSSVEERKQLARAKDAVERARQRLEATRRWRTRLEREEMVYRGRVERLRTFLNAGAPRALASLHAMADRLDEYVSIQPEPPPDAEPGASPEPDRPSMARAPGAGATRAPTPPRDLARLLASLPDPERVADAKDTGPDALPPLSLPREDRFRLGALADPRAPDSRTALLVTDSARHARRIALHRAAPAAPEDSGWRMLGLDDDEPRAWRRVQLADVLRSRPGVYDPLRLPEGWTILLEPGNDSPIRAVFDPSATEHWSSMRGEDAQDDASRSEQT